MSEELAPLCNLCGFSCVLGAGHPSQADYGLIKAQVLGGYNSTAGNGGGALDDTTRYTFSMCEFCLDWLFGSFKLPVEVDNYLNDRSHSRQPDPEPWSPAAVRVVRDDWREMKDRYFEEADRRTSARNAKT